MKFEFSAAIKAVPMADIRLSIDCNADELSVMLSDPVYQEIGHALATKLSQAQPNRSANDRQSADHRDNHKANHAQPNDRVEYLRRVVETEVKNQKSHNETVNAAIKSLQEQLSRMFNRIVQNKF
jgi:hypothetical protein